MATLYKWRGGNIGNEGTKMFGAKPNSLCKPFSPHLPRVERGEEGWEVGVVKETE